MDRAYGGVSLIIHSEGTNRPNSPNSPLRPEFVKADVYFPGYLFNENESFHPIISRFTQQFITGIALPVIERWERCAREKWGLTQGQNNSPPPPYLERDEKPVAIPNGSSSFVIHGHKVVVDTADNAGPDEENDDGYSQLELEMFLAIEKNGYMELQINSLLQELTETKKALSESLARECTLTAQLSSFTPSRHSSAASSPSRRPLLRGPVTPRKLLSFNPSTPAKDSGSSCLHETGRLEHTSPVLGGQVPRSTKSSVHFDEFMDFPWHLLSDTDPWIY